MQTSQASSDHVSYAEIWRLTWPQILMMLFQFMVGFTDVVVAGRIVTEPLGGTGSDVQAALGLITQCHFFLLVVVMALCNGGIAAMSQSLGAKLPKRAMRYIGLIFQAALVLCILTIFFGYVFRDQIFNLLDIPAPLRHMTDTLWVYYLMIIPWNYLIIISTAIFRSHKNVWIPLASGIVVCVLNGFLDFGLGLGYFGMPNFGAKGIVIASLFSVCAGAIFNVFILIKFGYVKKESFAPLRWQRKALPYIAKVALPSGSLQLLWQLGYIMLFYIAGTMPVDDVKTLAGLTAGMRIESVLFLPAVAFSSTGSILVGHCLGAGRKAEARLVGIKIAATGAISMSLAGLIIYRYLPEIVAFVVPDVDVRHIATSYMHYNLLSLPFTVTSMIMSGIMTGAGATVYLAAIYGAATWFIRLPLAWYLGHIVLGSATGIFMAMLVSQVAQALSAVYVFLRWDWYKFSSMAKRFK